MDGMDILMDSGNTASYLLSIEMERLLERGATVSLFSLVVVGSEEEEEKMEAGEFSFTESGGESRKRNRSDHDGFPFIQINTSKVIMHRVCHERNIKQIINLGGGCL